MAEDAMAKVRLLDGREVWRQVKVFYREVRSGRWVSPEEVEKLLPGGGQIVLASPEGNRPDLEELRRQIVSVQAQIAMDREAGQKSTSAARLVLKVLSELEEAARGAEKDSPWFVLGRELAEKILQLLEDEIGEKREKSSQK